MRKPALPPPAHPTFTLAFWWQVAGQSAINFIPGLTNEHTSEHILSLYITRKSVGYTLLTVVIFQRTAVRIKGVFFFDLSAFLNSIININHKNIIMPI